MSDLTEFFLGSPSAVAELECIDITHPDFTRDYHIVRNHMAGVTVTLETLVERTYTFYPLIVKPTGFRDDMEQGFQVILGDLGDLLPMELQAVKLADSFSVHPEFTYRSYRSDDLSQPLFGPVKLEIRKVKQTSEGATFLAQAPRMNDSRTGELYRLDRFPMLRGLL